MGFMKDLDRINSVGNNLDTRNVSASTDMLVLLKLLEMQWPTLDQEKAVESVNKYLKKHNLLRK